MDSIIGHGIGHALHDAESVSAVVLAGMTRERPLNRALVAHHRARDAEVLAMHTFTLGLASLARADSSPVDQFVGAIAGAVRMDDYLRPGSIRSVVGLRGPLKMIGSRVRSGGR